jgi:hypothetical protein
MKSESPALDEGRRFTTKNHLNCSSTLLSATPTTCCFQISFGCSLLLANEQAHLPKKLRQRRTIARHRRSPSPAPRLRTRRGGHTPRALENAQQRSSSIASIESERKTQRTQASSELTAKNRDDRRGLVRAVRTMHRIISSCS